jgi:polyisoprenoid-binding protein YceI
MYVEAGQIIEGRFTMDMTTIKATDIDDESLDNTMMDRFNTAEYPTAEFLLNEATTNQVSGIMTMNGQSREISFPATVIVEDDTVIANAEFALDRTQWGVDG